MTRSRGSLRIAATQSRETARALLGDECFEAQPYQGRLLRSSREFRGPPD
jgi:hypothetical protein